jgi:AcrR family transcriptional regulator
MSTSRRTPAARRPRAAYHHGDLAAALIAAATALVEEVGPAAVSLREAARRAGVSHNAPYRHFADRAALLAAVAEAGFRDFGARLAAAVAGAAEGRGLAAMGRAYVGFALDRPGVHRLMFSDQVDRAAHSGLAAAAKEASAVLRRAVGAPGPAGDGPRSSAALRAWALAHGLANLIRDGEILPRGAPRAAVDALVASVLEPPPA